MNILVFNFCFCLQFLFLFTVFVYIIDVYTILYCITLVMPENHVMALPLMSTEVPKRSIEEYLMFFRHYTKRYRYRLFEKELEDEVPQCYDDQGPTLWWGSGDFDSWWKTRFAGLSDASTAAKVVQTGQVIVTFIIVAGDLQVDLGEEDAEYEVLAEEKTYEATSSARKNKGKETTQAQDSVVQPDPPVESPSPPPTKMKRLIKGVASESKAEEELAATPTTTTETNEEL
ncbi:unnamed protein product [Prunus armeniaca]